ncbi:SAM-dependent methyltransferase [Streptomyces sp. NPDC000851]
MPSFLRDRPHSGHALTPSTPPDRTSAACPRLEMRPYVRRPHIRTQITRSPLQPAVTGTSVRIPPAPPAAIRALRARGPEAAAHQAQRLSGEQCGRVDETLARHCAAGTTGFLPFLGVRGWYRLSYRRRVSGSCPTQGRILRSSTDRFLRLGGLRPGMSVLDLGSGMGDVSMLAAGIVGPRGRVLGIDRDPAATEKARRRARNEAFDGSLDFEVTELDDFDTTERFDAVVGRYVLLYQKDPADKPTES